jgi:hypothetical protein
VGDVLQFLVLGAIVTFKLLYNEFQIQNFGCFRDLTTGELAVGIRIDYTHRKSKTKSPFELDC